MCAVTGCGALSGAKTDMAINVYTPGCHLLTHDDVIGSRRVSYILYLCGSEEAPWEPAWGGALRLYPTTTAADGTKVPTADWTTVRPPAWNQLAFFEVVPGESFHDVEEVYAAPDGAERTRMAISGWFHIPQRGEAGFVAGLEEALGKKSSLASLQSKSEQYDRPQPRVAACAAGADEHGFSAAEIEFLLRYVHPTYLTPDTLEQLAERFAEESSVQIAAFLRETFAAALHAHVLAHDTRPSAWPVAVPPHKQKFLYLQADGAAAAAQTPIEELLTVLLPSPEFRKLLQHATGLRLTSRNLLARRFRRGMDYTLATGLHSASPAAAGDDAAKMQLEITLSLTPSSGWEPAAPAEKTKPAKKSRLNPARADAPAPAAAPRFDDSARTLGGYEMYMSAEDDDATNDPAVYQAAQTEEEDGVLFMNYPAWNCLNIALRDEGVLKFVKYVSAAAAGDRWDVIGEFGVEEMDDDDDESGESDDGEGRGEEYPDYDDDDDDSEGADDDGSESSSSEDGGKWDDEEEWKGCSP